MSQLYCISDPHLKCVNIIISKCYVLKWYDYFVVIPICTSTVQLLIPCKNLADIIYIYVYMYIYTHIYIYIYIYIYIPSKSPRNISMVIGNLWFQAVSYHSWSGMKMYGIHDTQWSHALVLLFDIWCCFHVCCRWIVSNGWLSWCIYICDMAVHEYTFHEIYCIIEDDLILTSRSFLDKTMVIIHENTLAH